MPKSRDLEGFLQALRDTNSWQDACILTSGLGHVVEAYWRWPPGSQGWYRIRRADPAFNASIGPALDEGWRRAKFRWQGHEGHSPVRGGGLWTPPKPERSTTWKVPRRWGDPYPIRMGSEEDLHWTVGLHGVSRERPLRSVLRGQLVVVPVDRWKDLV